MQKKTSKHERAVWDQFWQEKADVANVYSPSARIIDNLQAVTNLGGKRVLEVGAGTGRTSLELVQLGAQVIVLDYSENALRIVAELISDNKDKVGMIRADAFHLPFKQDVFDIVFHQGLLEHFKNPVPLLQENHRVLRPSGLALVDVPQRYHIYTVIKHVLILFNAWFAGWETEFTIGGLRKLLQGTGFRVIHTYGDWMRPSLFYRMFREVMKKIGITLPLYPQGLRLLQRARVTIRLLLKRCPLSMYTFLDIGMIARK